jgi:hypothetical protein
MPALVNWIHVPLTVILQLDSDRKGFISTNDIR